MIYDLNFWIVLLSFGVFGVSAVNVYYLLEARKKLSEPLFKMFFTNIILISLLFAWFMLMEGFYRIFGVVSPSVFDFPLILTGLSIAILFFFLAKESKKISDTFGFSD